MLFSKKEKKGQEKGKNATVITANCLRDREVVSVCDGKRLGYVCDLVIDICTGKILSLILPGELKYFGFSRGEDCVIPWSAITRIGDDIILVNAAEIRPRTEVKL